MIPRPPRSTLDRSSAASDVYKRQTIDKIPLTQEMIRLESIAPDTIKREIARLRKLGTEKGWTFQVTATSVAGKNIRDITGGIEETSQSSNGGGNQSTQPPPIGANTVSYTNLTLPTSDLV